jgi:hypothetical protein
MIPLLGAVENADNRDMYGLSRPKWTFRNTQPNYSSPQQDSF